MDRIFSGTSKQTRVVRPDGCQHARNPISYHSHPYRALCGPCIATSPVQLLERASWLETCGVNVRFGLSSLYVCLTVKRDQYAKTQLSARSVSGACWLALTVRLYFAVLIEPNVVLRKAVGLEKDFVEKGCRYVECVPQLFLELWRCVEEGFDRGESAFLSSQRRSYSNRNLHNLDLGGMKLLQRCKRCTCICIRTRGAPLTSSTSFHVFAWVGQGPAPMMSE